MFKKISSIFAGLFLGALLTSCGGLGYSVVLWNNPEAGVCEGQIVKVYVKSNISHTYIIGIPETKKKVEIPLWQISDPLSKGKSVKFAAKLSEYAHTYASVKVDGLPIRAGTVNNAKQVYRLRKNEVIRVLYKGKGQIPTNGRGELPGEWLRVLTGTGTQGWCFSYNLNLFERVDDNLSAKIETVEETVDQRLAEAVVKRWCPEEYSEMLSKGRYNLERMSADYGFFFGQPIAKNVEEAAADSDENNQTAAAPVAELSSDGKHIVRIRTADINKSWSYEQIKKTDDDVYQFDDLQVIVTLKGRHSMAVQYMDTDGKMKNENFVAIDADIQAVIDNEMMRRQEELRQLVELGPVFSSGNYGTITFNNENNVTWRDYNLLVPSIISKSALGSVDVSVQYYLSNQLKNEFDGILTFHFVGMEKAVNFFYKKDVNGLRLEDATKAQIKNNVVNTRGSSPLVMYFSAN